ncbi:MAG TPA: FAD-dependent oxidoreductase [Pyrinomonadaceae bacterium]|nr:FAD-dependent oxidoreductase [Pyrinomonadaceae bacterium]
MSFETNRRQFLRGAIAASALLAAQSRVLSLNYERHFAAVKVSRDRVIREVVGLRPYRAEGFVVDAERVGNKLIVHNYGHGGAGMTLSWGTASLAVDLLSESRQVGIATGSKRHPQRSASPHFAVLGCGVSGLSTARTLQRRFQNGPGTVTIYARELPPDTTSNISGAHWSPTTVFDPEVASAKFNEQFQKACRISNRAFQLLAGTEYGVRWIETFELYRNEAQLAVDLPGGNDLYPAIEIHRDPDHYFGFPFVKQFSTMLIEPSIYLSALLRDFYIAGGRVVVKEFRSHEEIMRLPEPIVFNCTGLGARALFNDQKLGPVRGQLEVLMPQPEIDYCYLSRGYMFPRRDGIILGGTFDHNDWSLAPRPEQAAGILEVHSEIMKGVK